MERSDHGFGGATADPLRPISHGRSCNGRSAIPDATVPGINKSAATYFGELNTYEQQLNAFGYSLRSEGPNTTLVQAVVNMDAINNAATDQLGVSLTNDPRIMAPLQGISALKDTANAAAQDTDDQVLRGFQTLAGVNPPDGFAIHLAPTDQKTLPSAKTGSIDNTIHREWTFGPQNPDQVFLAGKAVFNLMADRTKASGTASVVVDGRLLNQDFNLLDGNISSNGDLAFSDTAATATLSAEMYLKVLGYERYRWPSTDHPEAGKVSYTADLSSFGVGGDATSPLGEWLTATRKDLGLDPWTYEVSESYDWYFMIGPVPANGHIGIDGQAGVDWSGGINVSGAKADLSFNASVSVWADAGLGVPDVVSIGGIADLTLIDSQFDFEGSSRFELGDGSSAGSAAAASTTLASVDDGRIEPRVVSEFKATRSLTFLKGKAGAYWEILTPTSTPPFLEPKRHEYLVFNWDGFSNTGTIFDYKKICTVGSYDVFGAPSSDDIQSAKLDQNLDDHFHEVVNDDAQHQQAMQDLSDVGVRQAAARGEFAKVIASFQAE